MLSSLSSAPGPIPAVEAPAVRPTVVGRAAVERLVEPCPMCDLSTVGPCPACDGKGWISLESPVAR